MINHLFNDGPFLPGMLYQVLKSTCFWISIRNPWVGKSWNCFFENQARCLGGWWVKEGRAHFHCHWHHHPNIILLDTMFPLHPLMRWSDSRSPIQSGQLTPRGPPHHPPHPYWHLINDNLTRTCLYCQKRILFEREQKRLKKNQSGKVIKLFHREVVPLSPFPTLLLERLDLPHQVPQWHWNFSWDFQITIPSLASSD